MLTIAEIRRQYPSPMSMREPDPDGAAYCVAGAIVQAHQALLTFTPDNCAFPGEYEFTWALLELNPALDDADVDDEEDTQAWVYANAILDLNDARNFEGAWRLAEEALTFGGNVS